MTVHGVALAALAGLGIFLLQPERWSAPLLLGGGVAALLAGLVLSRQLRGCAWPSLLRLSATWPLYALSVALAMAAWGSLRTGAILSAGISPQQEGASVAVQFIVQDLPVFDVGDGRYRPATWRFEAEIVAMAESATGSMKPLERPFLALVSWPARADGWLPKSLIAGDQWQAVMSLRAAAGSRNFYGFDFETWLFENRVRAVGRVSSAKKDPLPIALTETSPSHPSVVIDRAREAIRQAIAQALPEARHRGVMSGLVVGDQRAIGSADWAVFSETGVSHLMSISGMHVTMFALLARLAVRLLWQAMGRLGLRVALYLPVPIACAVAASLAAIGYALLAGFNIPAQRTAVMVSVAAMASLTGLRAQRWGVISLTLLVVLLMDPMAPLAPGFWLSFVAVAILFGLSDRKTVLGSAVAAQAAITIGLAPLTIAFFHQVSLVGPLANALAIPVVTFVVTPLAMVGAVMAFFNVSAPLVWGHAVFDWLFTFLVWCADWSWASLSWHAPPLWASLVACVGVLIALNASLSRMRHLAWGGLGAVFLGVPSTPTPGAVEARFLDVGQGTAIVLRTASHTLVYDTGPTMGQTHAAERIVIPQLYALGIRRIDGLVISHGDDDHASGLGAVVRSHRPPWVTTSIPHKTVAAKLAAAGASELPLQRCRLGLSWVWDDVWFRFVYPFGATPAEPDLEGENEDSCVLEVIDAQGRRLLLTGDIPQMQEEEIVDRAPWLHHDAAARAGAPMVVVAAHHGSRGSSAEKFLSALAPAAVVFQAGYRSRFHHPHPEVLQRLQALDIPSRRTDLEGDLLLTWNDRTPQFTSAAETRRRFWHPPRSDPRLLGDPSAVHIPGHAAHLVRSR